MVADEFLPYLLNGLGQALAERLDSKDLPSTPTRWMQKTSALSDEDRLQLVGLIEFFSGGGLGMEKVAAPPIGPVMGHLRKIWPAFQKLYPGPGASAGGQILGRGMQAATVGFPAYELYRYGQGEQGGLQTAATIGAGLLTLPMGMAAGAGALKKYVLPTGVYIGAGMAGSAADRALGFKTRGERELGAYQEGAQQGIQQGMGMAQPQIQAQIPEYTPASSGLGVYDRGGQFHADPRYTVEAQMTERRFRDAVKSGQI